MKSDPHFTVLFCLFSDNKVHTFLGAMISANGSFLQESSFKKELCDKPRKKKTQLCCLAMMTVFLLFFCLNQEG